MSCGSWRVTGCVVPVSEVEKVGIGRTQSATVGCMLRLMRRRSALTVGFTSSTYVPSWMDGPSAGRR